MCIEMDTEIDCLDMSENVQAPASAYNEVFIAGDDGREEYAAIALVKFLISRNISLDAINDSHFRSLLKSLAQNGRSSCILLENPAIIQKSLWKFEQGVKYYMQMVVESWKTTGCTMIGYDLKGKKGNPSPLDQNKLVLGFYSPKGFIFVELPPSKKVDWYYNYYEIGNALDNLVPDSSYQEWTDVIQFVQPAPSIQSKCQYQACDLSDTYESCHDFAMRSDTCAIETHCISQQVELFWRKICKRSKWVKSLIKKSDMLYEYIVSSGLHETFNFTLKQDSPRQLSIIQLEFELRSWLSRHSKDERFELEIDTDVLAIIDNNEFWKDGNALLHALAPLFKIPYLMDTLIPSSGYLNMAIANVSILLETYAKQEPLKFKQIWKDFVDEWKDKYSDPVLLAANYYLNPAYIAKLKNVQENLNFENGLIWGFVTLLVETDEEHEALHAEIETYKIKSNNPFVNISISEVEAIHPITLWSKYGGQFPQLQKCEYKLLSMPSCCLCKQVEKMVSKLEGADNFMLRLNVLMMEEFAKMGDQIYQPIYV